jgi:hypothetical protein
VRSSMPQPNPYARTNLIHTGKGRQAIVSKMERIRLDTVSFDNLPLSEVVSFLRREVLLRQACVTRKKFASASARSPNTYRTGARWGRGQEVSEVGSACV